MKDESSNTRCLVDTVLLVTEAVKLYIRKAESVFEIEFDSNICDVCCILSLTHMVVSIQYVYKMFIYEWVN